MVKKVLKLFVICLCITAVYCNIWDPRVWPETFVDDGKPFIEFTCGAYLKSEDWLSWYKGSGQEILTTIQQQNEGNRTITLLWPLASLKNDEVYCSKENESYWDEGHEYWKKKTNSKPIPINFLREIEPINIEIESGPWVTPAKFEDNGKQVIEFTCYAYLTKEKTLSWYQIKEKRVSKLGMIQQKANYGYTKITLQKTLWPCDNGSQIYCEKEGNEVKEEEKILITFDRYIEPLGNIWDPRVWPETFVDDGNPFIEFTCGAYLKSEDWLSWYKGSDQNIFTTIKQEREGYRTLKLLWPLTVLEHDEVLHCCKENESYWDEGQEYWKKTESKPIPTKFEPTHEGHKLSPWVMPAEFVDDGKQVIEFTCYAYSGKGNTLSWNQIKDKSVSKLGMVQQEAHYGYTKITLQKTLEPSDNSSQIYCEMEGKEVTEEHRILITFDRYIEAMETPYVTVEPSADVAFFDEDEKLEFVCSGSKTVDGRAFTWYLQTPGFDQVVPPDQHFSKTMNLNCLTLPMGVFDHGTLIYCAQDFTFRSTAATNVTSYGELARSRTITLLHRGQCNKKDQPRVTPDTYEDDQKRFVQFTCYAFLESGQLLSWYQSTGLSKSATLLRLVQLQDPRAKEGEWVVLTLNKTLEPGDNGSEVYCARQSVLPDGSFSDVLSASERIPLTFHRDIPPLVNAFITVEPNTTDIFFDVNTTLQLTCSGSKPVDRRNYTWLKEDSESRLAVLEGQKYDQTTNLNVLEMSLSETHHLNRLICALGFLSYIRLNDGSPRLKMYGELTEPKTITLILRDKASEEKEITSHNDTKPHNDTDMSV